VRLSQIVIDEAHCVSEWGESFRPAYLRLGGVIAGLGKNAPGEGGPVVTAFTATASAPVLEKIERYLFGGLPARRVTGNPDRSGIVYHAKGALVKNLAVRDLLAEHALPALVFCASRAGTEALAAYLRREFAGPRGLPETEIRFYHAGLSREEKRAVEEWFFTSRRGILAATCAYGMGVDKPDIRTVIHRDCPRSVEAYLQESGRAGRDGGRSLAVLLWGPDDGVRLARVEAAGERRRMARLLAYARNVRECRRAALLRMLDYDGGGEAPPDGERCCDVCGGTARPLPREEETLLGFFRRNRRRFTVKEAARTLAEAPPLNWTEKDAGEALDALLSSGKLRVSKNPLWKGRLTV